MQEDYKGLDTTTLIEKLMEQTNQYTSKMLAQNSAELYQHEYEITMILDELKSRNKGYTNISDPNIEFASGAN